MRQRNSQADRESAESEEERRYDTENSEQEDFSSFGDEEQQSEGDPTSLKLVPLGMRWKYFYLLNVNVNLWYLGIKRIAFFFFF